MNSTAKVRTIAASTNAHASSTVEPVAARALPPMPNISSRKFFRH